MRSLVLRSPRSSRLQGVELPNWAFQNNNRQAGPRHPFNTDRLVPLENITIEGSGASRTGSRL